MLFVTSLAHGVFSGSMTIQNWVWTVPHRLLCLNIWSPAGGAVLGGWGGSRRRSLAGGSASAGVVPLLPSASCSAMDVRWGRVRCTLLSSWSSRLPWLPLPWWILYFQTVSPNHFLPLAASRQALKQEKSQCALQIPVDCPPSPSGGSALSQLPGGTPPLTYGGWYSFIRF